MRVWSASSPRGSDDSLMSHRMTGSWPVVTWTFGWDPSVISIVVRNPLVQVLRDDEVFDVNVYGVIRVTQAFIGLLKR